MAIYQCFSCGFRTSDKGVFLSSNGDGTLHWLTLICPQCSLVSPPLAEVGDGPRTPYKSPNWVIDECNDGLYVRAVRDDGGSNASPMIRSHQLWDVMYKGGMTYGAYHQYLITRGNERKDAFRVRMDGIQKARMAEGWTDAKYVEQMDLARKDTLVGPYDTKVTARPPQL